MENTGRIEGLSDEWLRRSGYLLHHGIVVIRISMLHFLHHIHRQISRIFEAAIWTPGSEGKKIHDFIFHYFDLVRPITSENGISRWSILKSSHFCKVTCFLWRSAISDSILLCLIKIFDFLKISNKKTNFVVSTATLSHLKCDRTTLVTFKPHRNQILKTICGLYI